jgi:hypothetical protein
MGKLVGKGSDLDGMCGKMIGEDWCWGEPERKDARKMNM